MNTSQEEMIVVYRTGKVYEFDMVNETLRAHKIPAFSYEQTSGGLRLAMPATPSAEPGTWWSIQVPQSFQKKAQAIINDLPCGKKLNPEIWDGIDPAVRASMRWFYKIVAIGLLIWLVISVIRWLLDKQ